MKALFPISLSNQRFSTALVVPAIDSLVDKYDEVLFLIADRLQVYNRAIGFSDNLHTRSKFEGFRKMVRLTGTFEERRRWLDKVKIQLGERAIAIKWRIESIDAIADAKAFEILRNIDILFGVDRKFRLDVQESANDFALRHPEHLRSVASLLSTRYILEELALSIRMRVQRRYTDEYYIGSTLLPALRLYSGKYVATPWELAGLQPTKADFRFFELIQQDLAPPYWAQVLSNSPDDRHSFRHEL